VEAQFFMRPPDEMGEEEVRAYLRLIEDRQGSP
jgi:hypothetical protein